MNTAPRRLVVGRLRKPHGLKGEFTVFPLTSTPDAVFAPGARLMRVDLAGAEQGEVEVETAKPYHREWLVKFRGIADRDLLDTFRGHFLSAEAATLTEPEGDEVYLHELDGFAVRSEAGEPLGLITSLYEMAQGLMIEVQGPKREFLLPYKKEFIVQVEREARRLVVRVPDGLLD